MTDFRAVFYYAKLIMWLVGLAAFIVAAGVIIGVVLSLRSVHAEDPFLCTLYAREYVRIQLVTAGGDPDLRTATADYIEALVAQRYYRCLNAERPLPWPGDIDARSTSSWAVQMNKLILSKQGTEPATGEDVQIGTNWRDRCKKEYRTWRESDATVIRYQSKGKRVPCPYAPGP